MLGAIIGDVVGSVYEWDRIKTKDFPLFRDDCFFTDDTVMTVAVADALMQSSGEKVSLETEKLILAMKTWGRMYPDSGYGGRFSQWLEEYFSAPYNSWGNGSAMRVSPCALVRGVTLEDAEVLAMTSASVTHNHPEGVKGAVETARAIWLMRQARDAGDIDKGKRAVRERSSYNLSRTLNEIRPTYQFNESCQDTVPQAITAFLESTDFEDAIRNAISLGGDSDTLAAITGGIAEAAYGIPKNIRDRVWQFLDEPVREVCRRWDKFNGGE